jgi:VCBS repeat-containing protein
VNDAPGAADQSVTTEEDTAQAIALGATDAEGGSLTYAIATGPTHGTLSGSAPTVTYTPASNYTGPDSFTFKANDGTIDSNVATVAITVTAVNDAPVATNGTLTTLEETPAGGTLGATDVDGDPLTYAIVANGTKGVATMTNAATGAFTYTPNANANGTDSVTFRAHDAALDSNTATVAITITAVNQAPVATSDSYTTNEDTPLTVPVAGVLTNDSDLDGDTLHAVLVSSTAHGALALNANGSFTYTPAANYNGPDSFSYGANDSALNSNVATVSITVVPVNSPPVAVNDSYTTTQNTAVTIAAPGVLANDSDVDSAALTAIKVTNPAHGTVTVNANGSIVYTPTASYSGPDSFTYQVNDGSLNSSIATVTIAVNCPCTIWPMSATPAQIATDTAAVELGVRFRSDVSGTITGLRFYKGTGNTGTHVAHLWTNAGVLLATATFTGETATGWQTVNFAAPVAIAANTTYVASYHTNKGRYAASHPFFASAGVDSAPLHALQDGVDGSNGVYVYGAIAFPNQTFDTSNYWVDVIFKP